MRSVIGGPGAGLDSRRWMMPRLIVEWYKRSWLFGIEVPQVSCIRGFVVRVGPLSMWVYWLGGE